MPGNEIDSDSDLSLQCEDCDDADPTSYPGAPETPGDGIDQDCDGLDLPWTCDPDDYEPNDSSVAPAIGLPGWTDYCADGALGFGTLCPSDVDWYSFSEDTHVGGDAYHTVDLTGSTADGDFEINVYDSTLQSIGTSLPLSAGTPCFRAYAVGVASFNLRIECGTVSGPLLDLDSDGTPDEFPNGTYYIEVVALSDAGGMPGVAYVVEQEGGPEGPWCY